MSQLNQLIVDENNIAFHPMMGNSYKLNDIGKNILNLIREGYTKPEIVEKLANQYDVAQNELFIDVSDFYAKLKIYGLLS